MFSPLHLAALMGESPTTRFAQPIAAVARLSVKQKRACTPSPSQLGVALPTAARPKVSAPVAVVDPRFPPGVRIARTEAARERALAMLRQGGLRAEVVEFFGCQDPKAIAVWVSRDREAEAADAIGKPKRAAALIAVRRQRASLRRA